MAKLTYNETQYIYLIWGISGCIGIFMLFTLFQADFSKGSTQLSFTITGLILGLMLLNFYKFSIRVTQNSLRLSFGCGWIFKEIKLSDIDTSSFETDHLPWYYGIGWKYDFRGNQFFNGRPGKALRFRLNPNKEAFRVGTNNPIALADALKSLK